MLFWIPSSVIDSRDIMRFGNKMLFLKDIKSLNALKPPSARIHVVEPSSLYIRISGYLWYLEIGREYNISFVVTGADNNVIYIPETRGGTGSFTWSSMNPEVASVDSSGILLTANLGNTEVIAQDAQNNAHFGKAIIQVLQPTGIAFGRSHLEAEVC
ncbi:unnamed protein product [Wuchereria bancrofti]|uniref:BIG2 domain-containing protein n=1 Tax=Wuchereria bancrofti TaxID=6293 RepID=A0A3P7E272_WUCBA|nr:unnamed protein product [Wuchereria bancrofti]